MIPSTSEITALHRKYAPNDKLFDLVLTHCKVVAEIALWCADNMNAKIDKRLLEAAANLHDIGAYALVDETGRVNNINLYPQHAILGAKILLDEGFDPKLANLVENHVLLGLTKQEIAEYKLALPARNYVPDTMEGEILCYADRFHSKKPKFNSVKAYTEYLRERSPSQLIKFEASIAKFGQPDLETLAKKYGHPII